MEFSDQSHIERVRDALHDRAEGAVVMVGSGFSANAVSIRPSLEAPPIWQELAAGMIPQLYPPSKGRNNSSTANRGSTSDVVRLAQEYEAAFGRPALHRHLRARIRDGDFVPGDAHMQLLELPWRDIFTTNWDTLLERAAPSIEERHYNLVRSTQEIPLATRPRIVKLHGSLDARFPLICTEEDYRTYPAKFAPFVNTVQQAMMENLVVLIGFSGDDPNFLHWSGWVRDNLGASAPKIYLAGWLGLQPHRRRMLESRNIVPIDLAGHPKADEWRKHPRHVRHACATEWILRSLEYGEAYDIYNWPSPPKWTEKKIPNHLEPLPQKTINAPRAEPKRGPEKRKSPEGKLEAVQELIDVWSYNRTQTYPGWLSIPSGVRGKMRSTREHVDSVIGVLPQLHAADRLRALHELMWRWEIVLEPISELEEESLKIVTAARDALAQIDCRRQEIDGKVAPDANWTSISESWVAVNLALATAARFRFNEDEFNQRLSAASWFRDGNPDIEHRIRHERCLWAIFALDFEALEELLANWRPEDCDPAWMMRKTALLFEVGRDSEAKELNAKALHDARSVPDSDTDVAAKSREAWALLCARASLDWDEYWVAVREFQRRWAELTSVHCNAPYELQLVTQAFKGESKPKKGPHFDLEMTWKEGLSFSRADFDHWVAAHRTIRLFETHGLPPRAGNWLLTVKNIKLAARELWQDEQELAVRLVLRSANYETRGTLNFLLARARVATIPDDAVKGLADDCIQAIEFILPRIATGRRPQRDHWRERLMVLLEALSRFVLRLEAGRVDVVLTKALGWCSSQDVASSMHNADPLRNLLLRTWEALPSAQRTKRILDLLEAPIVGLDGFEAGFLRADGTRSSAEKYPDPCDALRSGRRPRIRRTASNRPRLKNVFSLLTRGMRGGQEARRRAANRLSALLEVVNPTAEERLQIADALWGDDFDSHKELPSGTDIFDWAFLVFPEPKRGLAAERFRAKWFDSDELNKDSQHEPGEILRQVGRALGSLRARSKPLALSDHERLILARATEQWVDLPIPPLLIQEESAAIFPIDEDEKTRDEIAGLECVLLEIEVSAGVARKMYNKVRHLNESKQPARRLYAGLVRILPKLTDEIVEDLRLALASDSQEVAADAALGLGTWLRSASDTALQLVPPPAELVREIGVIIAIRRKAALTNALAIAEWAFSEGSDEQQEAIGDFAAEGLGKLAGELQYDTEQNEDFDLLPRLRWRCYQLAIAMSKKGFDSHKAICRWQQEAKDDPLPELRYGITRLSTRPKPM